MAVHPPFTSALAAYRAGRTDEARREAEALWQASCDAKAAALMAQVEMDAGQLDAALAWNGRARSADAGDPRYAVQHARLLLLKGESETAFESFAGIVRSAPDAKGAWSGLAAAARASNRRAEARALSLAGYDSNPTRAPALRALLELVGDEPPGEPRIELVPESKRPPITVIACSVDDRRFAAMAAQYDRALADWPHDIVRIADARSLAEGYTRGAAAAKGEWVVFTHDDVEVLAVDFGHRLTQGLRECDIVGVAGATRVSGPAWPFAGWPYLHGSVIYRDGAGYRVTAYSRNVPLAHDIKLMDGVFLAMRRDTALRIGWDAQTCDGFHGYDVDFTWRAFKAGFRLAVASDLGIVHLSYGSFDDRWEATAKKLAAKHPELAGTARGDMGFVPCTVADAQRAMALVDNWARIGSSRA